MRISDWSSDVCSSDLTTKIKTTAVRRGDRYVINGQKVWISRVQHSDLMILLARTTPLEQVTRKSEGMSIFLVDLHHAVKHGMQIRPIPNMVNHETNELFFDNLEIPVENLLGEEGKGFRSEEHTSELQSLMRISYAVFCLKQKN